MTFSLVDTTATPDCRPPYSFLCALIGNTHTHTQTHNTHTHTHTHTQARTHTRTHTHTIMRTSIARCSWPHFSIRTLRANDPFRRHQKLEARAPEAKPREQTTKKRHIHIGRPYTPPHGRPTFYKIPLAKYNFFNMNMFHWFSSVCLEKWRFLLEI